VLLPSRIAFLEPAGIPALARLLPADPAVGLFSQDDAALRFASSYLRTLSRTAVRTHPPRLVASLRWHALNPRGMLLLAFSEMTETEAQVRAGLLPIDEHSGLLPQSATGLRVLVVSADGQLIVQRRDGAWLPGVAKTLLAREIAGDASLLRTTEAVVHYCMGAAPLLPAARALRTLSLVVWEKLQRWEVVQACDFRGLSETTYFAESLLAALRTHGLSSFDAMPLEQAMDERGQCASAAVATIIEQAFPLIRTPRPV
jgi:hypothetical protein